MKRFRRVIWCLAVVVSVAGLAACARGNAAQVQRPNPSTVTLYAVPTADAAGLYVAYDKGFFRDQGLNVKIVPTKGGEDTLGVLKSGKADFVEGNYVSFIQFQAAHQLNLRIIADSSLMQAGNQALYVMPNSPYRTVSDLANAHATIGVNTLHNIGQVLIGSALQSAGKSLNDVHLTAPSTGFPGELAELKSGQISAAWLPEPFGTMAQQQLGARMLTDLDQGGLQNFPIGCVLGDQKWIQGHPATVAAFLRAYKQGQLVADTNRTAVQASLEKHTGVPPLIADTMTLDNYPLYMDISEMQRVPDVMFNARAMNAGYSYKAPYQISTMIQPEPGMVRRNPGG
ncbi:MAG: ABC transporter substrate-binding protein [Nocardiopsaceae bacterium]|nr:ABC transporter substrate-binding protein [Nocardiopsaceae bacterium]